MTDARTAPVLSTLALAWMIACGNGSSGSAPSSDDGGESGDGGSCGLLCGPVDCSSQGKAKDATTVSGVVYDPSGLRPVFNAIVYVPGDALAPFPEGVVCDRCGAHVTGTPLTTTLSDATGHFQLRNVPVGQDVSLVVQVGKWRRRTTIPSVAACVDNPLTDPNLTRLPRDRFEGDLPLMALVTGGCDAFECVLRKIGIADGEFTDSGSPGRVHVYKGINGAGQYASQPATALWGDITLMKKYDVVINSCECGEQAQEKTPAMLQNHFDYANAGGRVFDTHFNYYWIDHGPAPFPSTAVFSPGAAGQDTTTATLDTSFPKGDAFATWLQTTGASPTRGQLAIQQARYDAVSTIPPSTQWIHGTNGSGGPALFHYTFDAPLGVTDDQLCGKVLFSDFHAAAGSNVQNTPFPGECNSDPMTPQELALEFMLFDLSACIQNDAHAPQPPAQ